MEYLNKDEYAEVLFNQYNSQTAEDLIKLINESKTYVIELIDSNNKIPTDKSEFIASIIIHTTKYRKISFKQWKALKAFVNEYKRKEENTTFKSF